MLRSDVLNFWLWLYQHSVSLQISIALVIHLRTIEDNMRHSTGKKIVNKQFSPGKKAHMHIYASGNTPHIDTEVISVQTVSRRVLIKYSITTDVMGPPTPLWRPVHLHALTPLGPPTLGLLHFHGSLISIHLVIYTYVILLWGF